jgi:hypothetical protein
MAYTNLSPSEFYQCTFHELSIILEGYGKRQDVRYDEMICLAYNIVALDRTKKLPKIDELLSTKKSKPKKKSAVDMLEDIRKAFK